MPAVSRRLISTSNCVNLVKIPYKMNEKIDELVKEGDSKTAWIIWDEHIMAAINFPPRMEEENLCFTGKQLETVNWQRKTVFYKCECFDKATYNEVPIVKTLQGFWKKIHLWALKNQIKVNFINLRPKGLVKKPNFNLMKDFRFRQEELTKSALKQDVSGLIGAPTRYGKSTVIRNICRAWRGTPTLVVAPGKSLLKQTLEEMKQELPERDIKLVGAGSKVKYQSDDLTICSMDSLHKIDADQIRLVIVDEPHAIVSESRVDHIPRFHLARKYGLGASLEGRYDNRDFLLEGVFGPILANRTFREAVQEKAITNIKVAMVKIRIPLEPGDREKAYKKYVLENQKIHEICSLISNRIIPEDQQTLFFIKQEKQGRMLQEKIRGDIPLVMDKTLTNKEREELTKKTAENEISRIICSDIFVQGVTFHEIRCIVNCAAGGASTTTIQKPGRLAEVRPGKRHGIMIDFMFELPTVGSKDNNMNGVKAMARESRARANAYESIGYDVDYISESELENWYRKNDPNVPADAQTQYI